MKFLQFTDLKSKGIPHGSEHLWRLWNEGKFPKPIKIGRRNAWLETEIDAWLAERIAERDAEQASA